ncbi:MAG: response regulator [Bacteroidales bacterium]|nr:response regulator [Bacteroidales bacterium]
MEKKLHVLIVEDLPSDAELAKRELKTVIENFTVQVVDTQKDFIQALKTLRSDIIISDYQMPAFNGLSALKIRQEKYPFIPFIILTGSMNEDTAVNCMKAGADDYVIKEHIKRLGPAVLNAIEKKKIELKRKQAEEALRGSEELNRCITQTAGDAIISINSDGIILSWNNAAKKIFGYSPKETINNDLSIIIPEKYKKKHHSYLMRLKDGAKEKLIGKTIEITAERKGGTEFPIELSLSSWETDNQKHYTGIIRDITERKKVEQELISALEKATESDRLKSAFLINVSHEIRTPLNGILGFMELLKTTKFTNEEFQEYIINIEKSSARILNTFNDLIEISKVEANQMDVSVSEINVNEQIEYLYMSFRPEAEQTGLQISYKNSLAVEEAVLKTDQEKFKTILTNLLKNAIKFTNDGSIEFGYEKKGNHLEFFVKDTGIGFSKSKQEAIFKPFVQADQRLSKAYEGAGLGLSICKAYVKMLGGEIRVESEEGVGSQFYFTIPYSTPEKEIISGADVLSAIKPGDKTKKMKILIADDEEAVRNYLAIILKITGKEILYAATGIEAVELCQKNPDIELALMDIRMPEMDGIEATRQIRKFNKNVIIIAQTAYTLAYDREKALDAGCDDYITKPIRQDELVKMIEKHLKQ